MRSRICLVLLLAPCLALPAYAGIFGRKKEKVVDPRMRVLELIVTLKSDGDADKRTRAAEELRNYDGNSYPEIIPALVEALQGDNSPNVRAEAAQTLGKIRPVTQAAGEALEQATANDSSYRVRLQARSALLNYHWAGYRSTKKIDVPPLTPPSTTKEPPVVSTTTPAGTPAPVPVPTIPPTPTPMNNAPTGRFFQPTPQPTTNSSSGRFLPFLRRNTTPPPAPIPVPLPATPSNITTKEPPLAPPLDVPPQLPPAAPPVRTAPPPTGGDSGPDLP